MLQEADETREADAARGGVQDSWQLSGAAARAPQVRPLPRGQQARGPPLQLRREDRFQVRDDDCYVNKRDYREYGLQVRDDDYYINKRDYPNKGFRSETMIIT